jgi:hypothetical protein
MNLLKDLQINDVSSVDVGAGRGVRVMLMKRDNPQELPMDAIAKAQSMNDRQMIEFCKSDKITKVELGLLITDLAQAKRAAGESTQQADARFRTEDPLGRELHLAEKRAPGLDHAQAAAVAAIKKLSAPTAAPTVGPSADDQINALAERYRLAHSEKNLTHAQAVAFIMTTQQGSALYQIARTAHLDRQIAYGQGG